MNLPNKITVARLGLTVIIIILLCVPFSSFGFSFPKYDIRGVIVELQYLHTPLLLELIGAPQDGQISSLDSSVVFRWLYS